MLENDQANGTVTPGRGRGGGGHGYRGHGGYSDNKRKIQQLEQEAYYDNQKDDGVACID